MNELASNAGINVNLCEFCGKRVPKTAESVKGLDGMWAHRACVARYENHNPRPLRKLPSIMLIDALRTFVVRGDVLGDARENCVLALDELERRVLLEPKL